MATAALRESDRPYRAGEKRFWTYDELLTEMGETTQPMELWDGELVMSPMPTPTHQTIVLNFASRLKAFVVDRKVGQVFLSVDVILTQSRVVQPDVLYIAKGNMRILQDRVRGVPDLCMEVISQSWRRDRIEKKALYEQVGVKEYWIVDPELRSIEVLVNVRRAYRSHAEAAEVKLARSKLLPGFAVSFNQLLV